MLVLRLDAEISHIISVFFKQIVYAKAKYSRITFIFTAQNPVFLKNSVIFHLTSFFPSNRRLFLPMFTEFQEQISSQIRKSTFLLLYKQPKCSLFTKNSPFFLSPSSTIGKSPYIPPPPPAAHAPLRPPAVRPPTLQPPPLHIPARIPQLVPPCLLPPCAPQPTRPSALLQSARPHSRRLPYIFPPAYPSLNHRACRHPVHLSPRTPPPSCSPTARTPAAVPLRPVLTPRSRPPAPHPLSQIRAHPCNPCLFLHPPTLIHPPIPKPPT